LNPLNYRLEREGWDVYTRYNGAIDAVEDSAKVAVSDKVTAEPFRDLSGNLPRGVQANHLNQNAAFKSIIPREEGLAVGMRGDAFIDRGTPHYEFHKSLEQFWEQYRTGPLRGLRPTNAQYGQALQRSLEVGDFSAEEASSLATQAARQRRAFGLADDDLVPRVPGRINQKQ
jgi:hypothetical protein